MTSTATSSYYIGVSNNKALTGARKFVLDYPGRHHPDTMVFRLLKTGNIISMALVNEGHPQRLRTPGNEDAEKYSRGKALMPQHEN
jgi:hypothetical protein